MVFASRFYARSLTGDFMYNDLITLVSGIRMETTAVGLALIMIGGILVLVSVILILLGHYRTVKRRTTFPIGYLDSRPLIGKFKASIIPLRLKYKTKMEGKIIPKSGTGAFDLAVQDCFGWLPEAGIQWQLPSYKLLSNLTAEGEKTFELFLGPGDYMLFFRTKSENAEADIELTITDYIKPLTKLIEVGLVFMQVATPILVTGLVIYAGLSLA